MSEAAPILEMRGISKTFGAVRALRGVDLTVWPGEIHALMGENGAGKSTLMKILSGAYHADPGGRMLVDGREVAIVSPLDALRLGVAVIYQELSLAPNLSVQQNVCLGREAARAGILDKAAMRRQCADILKRLGADFRPETRVSRLSLAQQQMVEIARALSVDARILVMDEPTASLSSRETDKLFDLIRKLRADGLAIIYISHRMAEVYELADRCSVLRDGSYVGTLMREELKAEALVKMMVGRDLTKFYKKDHDAKGSRGEAILKVRGMSDGGRRVNACSFDLHQGEVLALAGLVGSGRTELARLIYGADPRTAGTIELDGKPLDIVRPIQAVNAGIVYLTEDRKGQGLFLDMTVQENINLQVVGRDAGKGGLLDLKKAKIRAVDAIKALSIRVAGPIVEVGSLSGGNQQKVLLSRLLETKPRVLILDEPTRGVDIGAKSEIYRIIDDLVKAGVGVLVISSEMPEVVGISDRVLVMREGEIVGEVGGSTGVEITQENIIALAAGLAQSSASAA